jgi:uncharacterized protein YbjT (DUF2867 family)
MILVVGATGQLGGLIAHKLIDQGSAVRILVREGSSYDALLAAGAEPVTGDLKDPASLRAACLGVDTIITTANSSARGGDDTVDTVDRAGNRTLIEAAVANGVRRFVFISNLGADPDSPAPFMAAKGETEQRLRDSGLTWTIIEPNLFMDKLPVAVVGAPALAGMPVTLVGQGQRVHSLIAMRDVAEYAVAALHRSESERQVLVIGGPEPVSWLDVVAAFERELGREVPVRTVPAGQPVPGMPDLLSGFLTALETYDSPLDMTQLSRTYGVASTTLEDWVHSFVTMSDVSSVTGLSS